MNGSCPKCGGVYTTPIDDDGSMYPDALIETHLCTTCQATFSVVID